MNILHNIIIANISWIRYYTISVFALDYNPVLRYATPVRFDRFKIFLEFCN